MNNDDSKFADLEEKLRSMAGVRVPDSLLDDLLDDLPREIPRADIPRANIPRANIPRENIPRENEALPRIPVHPALAGGALVMGLLVVGLLVSGGLRDPRLPGRPSAAFRQPAVTLAAFETDPRFIVPPVRTGPLPFPSPPEPKIRPELVRNPSLERGVGGLAEDWRMATVPAAGLSWSRTSEQAFAGRYSIAIRNTHQYARTVCNNWCQRVTGFQPGMRVVLRAAIRTQNATAANVCVQCWSDRQTLVGFCSTPLVRGTRDWTQVRSGDLVIPGNTRRVVVRAALAGTGQVWFDAIHLREAAPQPGDEQAIAVRPPAENFRPGQRPRQEETGKRSRQETDAEVARWLGQMGTARDRNFEAIGKLVALGPVCTAPLREILVDKSQPLVRRWQSAMALSGIGARPAIPDLFRVLEERDPSEERLQRVIVEGLLKYQDKGVVRLLEAFARHEQTPRELGKFTLERLDDPAFNPLSGKQWEKQFAWAGSRQQALARAREEQKLVLTVVYATRQIQPARGGMDTSAIPFHALLRGPLTDPDVKALIENHFVVQKVARHTSAFSVDMPRSDPDSLAEWQVDSHQIKPPALLFHTADGTGLGQIQGLGVFNARLLHAALVHVLKQAERTPVFESLIEVPGDLPDRLRESWIDASRQYLEGDAGAAIRRLETAIVATEDRASQALLQALAGKILHHEGRRTEARARLRKALDNGLAGPWRGEALYWLLDCELNASRRHQAERDCQAFRTEYPDSLWNLKIDLRRPNSEIQMAMTESFEMPDSVGSLFDPRPVAVALETAVPRALRYLVDAQSESGEWQPLSGAMQSFSQPAITAICGSAIRAWRSEDSGLVLPATLASDLEHAETRARQALDRLARRMSDVERLDYLQVWNQTYLLEYYLNVLDRDPDDSAARERAQGLVDLLEKHQYEEGGWSYLPPSSAARWGGIRPHSFNTAPILIELIRARRLGLNVGETVIERAVRSLQSVRSADGAFAYAPPDGFQWMTNQRAAIARDTLCELALHAAAGGQDPSALVAAFDRFHDGRADLEIPRKLYSASFNRNGHGAYFFAFGYFYASQALGYLDPSRRATVAGQLERDLLSIVELDGTWIDEHGHGKSYATGMILRTLFQIRRFTGS